MGGGVRWTTPLRLAYTSKPTENTAFFSLKYCFDPIVILTAENYVSYELLNSLGVPSFPTHLTGSSVNEEMV